MISFTDCSTDLVKRAIRFLRKNISNLNLMKYGAVANCEICDSFFFVLDKEKKNLYNRYIPIERGGIYVSRVKN
jgi:hypothetical protein